MPPLTREQEKAIPESSSEHEITVEEFLSSINAKSAKKLLAAVLWQGIADYLGLGKHNFYKNKKILEDNAAEWIFDNRRSLCSFVGICEFFGLDSDVIRSKANAMKRSGNLKMCSYLYITTGLFGEDMVGYGSFGGKGKNDNKAVGIERVHRRSRRISQAG